jgi:uncharacterized glyoxalase superfamily protein PhnB
MKKAKFKYAIPQLPSGDIEKTAEFCEAKLGFEVWAKYPERKHLIVGRGAVEFHFWQAASEKTANEIGSQSSCYIRVKNIEAFYSELKENKAPFRYELTDQPWGMKEMQVDDPYGNAIRFGEPTKRSTAGLGHLQAASSLSPGGLLSRSSG